MVLAEKNIEYWERLQRKERGRIVLTGGVMKKQSLITLVLLWFISLASFFYFFRFSITPVNGDPAYAYKLNRLTGNVAILIKQYEGKVVKIAQKPHKTLEPPYPPGFAPMPEPERK